MKITRGEMCECGKSVGFDGTKVYDWLEKNSVVVGRGRPSKSKVVEQDSESEDLFASLVKSGNQGSPNPSLKNVEQNHGGGAPVNPPTEDLVQKVGDDETLEKAAIKEAKEAEKAAKLAEKEAKAAEKAAKLAEKEAKKQEIEDAKAAKLAEKEAKEQEIEDAKAAKLAEKEAKEQEKTAKLAEKTAKLAEKASKEQEKILEKASKEQEKATKLAEKEAKSLLKKENKTLKEPKKKEEPKAIEEAVVGAEGVYGGSAPVEEEDSVIEMVYEGKKYLKSVISGVVYDMDENEIGAWKNDKIVLNDSSGSEEEEEEYN